MKSTHNNAFQRTLSGATFLLSSASPVARFSAADFGEAYTKSFLKPANSNPESNLKSRTNVVDYLMRTGRLLLVLMLSGCTNADTLPEGRWTGSMSPMNHSDLRTDIVFDVSITAGELPIVLIGPGGKEINVSEPWLEEMKASGHCFARIVGKRQ